MEPWLQVQFLFSPSVLTYDFLTCMHPSCLLLSALHLRLLFSRQGIRLVNKAASSLQLAQESKPDEFEALDVEITTLHIELESLKTKPTSLA